MTLTQCTDNNQGFLALAKKEQVLTIKQNLASSDLIYRQENKVQVIQQIVKAISFLLEVAGKDLAPFQVQILAGDLYEKFKHESFDDIVLMLKMARMGDFGKVYRVDSFVVMEWANKYLGKKAEEREKQYIAQKNKHKKTTKEIGKRFYDLPQELQEKFNKKFAIKQDPRRNMKDFLTNEKHRDAIKKAMKEDD